MADQNEEMNVAPQADNQSPADTAAQDNNAPQADNAPQAAAPQTDDATATTAAAAPDDAQASEEPAAPPEPITYHAVEKDGQVSAIWEMQGRKHIRTIDPRSRQGIEILRLYTTEHHEDIHQPSHQVNEQQASEQQVSEQQASDAATQS